MNRSSQLLAIALFLLLVAMPAIGCAQKKEAEPAAELLVGDKSGVGKNYGARDPLTCKSTKDPEKGPPSADQVRAYFISGFEQEKGTGTLGELYLTENVKVEIGKGRPFEQGDGSGDVDVHELIYPIRGSYTYYRCYPVNSVHPLGKNSVKVEQPKAEGLCYKTTFGDWKCTMADFHTGKSLDGYFPAPK